MKTVDALFNNKAGALVSAEAMCDLAMYNYIEVTLLCNLMIKDTFCKF